MRNVSENLYVVLVHILDLKFWPYCGICSNMLQLTKTLLCEENFFPASSGILFKIPTMWKWFEFTGKYFPPRACIHSCILALHRTFHFEHLKCKFRLVSLWV